jgi:hypothetical protein
MNKIFELLELKDKELHNIFMSTVTDISCQIPHLFIGECWLKYEKQAGNRSSDSSKNRNGEFLELLIQYVLCMHNILPFYKQARVAFVPNVKFDILLYTEEIGVLILSIKTSLRERYKQADLEAIALKQVHRRSKSFLLTLSNKECVNINKKIDKGEVAGLEQIINCFDNNFSSFIDKLKQYTFIEAGNVKVIIGKLVSENKNHEHRKDRLKEKD